MKIQKDQRVSLVVLNSLTLILCLILGCRSVNKRKVWHNGQWYNETEINQIKK